MKSKTARHLAAATALLLTGWATLPAGAACPQETWSPLAVPSPCRQYPPTGDPWYWTGSLAVSRAYRFDPETNICTPNSAFPLSQRITYVEVFTGQHIVIWGGWDNINGGAKGDGAVYDIATNQWHVMALAGAPTPRYGTHGVWTGTEVLIWGGQNGGIGGTLGNGGAYDPVSDTWRPIPESPAVAPRYNHKAVWIGMEMIVFGGFTASGITNTGGRLNPVTMTWQATSTVGAPDTLYGVPAALAAGTKMIVTGGYYDELVQQPPGFFGRVRHYRPDSRIYDPANDSWESFDSFSFGEGFSAVWTGQEMIFWGGSHCSQFFSLPGPTYWRPYCDSASGGKRVDASGNVTPVTTMNQPQERYRHSAVWTGSRMLLWGGSDAIFSIPLYYEINPSDDASYELRVDGDGDLDGFTVCGPPPDCNDADGANWATPGEVTVTADYGASGTTTLTWSAPAEPGGTAPHYDVLRSIRAWDFGIANATCRETDESDLTAITAPILSSLGVDFYLVRSRNGCPGAAGLGVAGRDSTGAVTSARTCP